MKRDKNRKTSQAAELAFLDSVLPKIKNRTFAIDGGANVGNWSVKLAEHFQKVIAFEPVDFSFVKLCERTKHLKSVRPMYAALMDYSCSVTMNLPKKRKASTSYYATRGGRVLATTIDDLTLPECGLIKLDLEGAEYRALRGAAHTLVRCKPVVIVECVEQQLARFGDSVKSIDRILRKAGYKHAATHLVNRMYVPC